MTGKNKTRGCQEHRDEDGVPWVCVYVCVKIKRHDFQVGGREQIEITCTRTHTHKETQTFFYFAICDYYRMKLQWKISVVLHTSA